MPSQNITALTNAAAFLPDALFYMAASPFGVTDDRKITGSTLFTTIAPLNNNTAALIVTNSAAPTTPQVVFTNTGGTRRMQVSMAGAASITDTFDDVSIFSSISGATLSLGLWNASDGGTGAELFLYTGAAGLAHLRIRASDGGAGNTTFLDVPNSGVLFTSNASSGGLILCTDHASGPIIFAAGDDQFTAEKGRFDAAGFTLGHVSTITGALNLANSASAFLTTIQAGNAAAARTYIWPTNFGASGSVLTDAAGNGILSWVVPAAGGMAIGGTVTSGTAGSVLFVNAGPILAQDNANFFWDDTNNRLGLGTATPAKLLHVNGIAQLGTVSATTGQLQLANSASANLTTIQAGNAAAAVTYTWPLNVGSAGAVLTDAAGNGTLSWAVAAAGGMAIGGTVTSGTAGSVLFVNAGPILAQDNANFFWDDTNNRLGLGTATPAKLLHVNGIAQLGTVSATTGQLQLANSASANLTTIQAGNAAAARTYTWPLDFGASGSVLTDAAGNGTLSWAAASGSGTVNAGTQFQMAYYATSAAAVSGLSNLVTDANGDLSHAATARTGTQTFYNRIITPADTALTASTASVGIQFGGNTSGATVIRQWATGNFTGQAEYKFIAPTYAAVGSSTITEAATVDIRSPIPGTSMAISSPVGLLLTASTAAAYPLLIRAASAQTQSLTSWQDSSFGDLAKVTAGGFFVGGGATALSGNGFGILNTSGTGDFTIDGFGNTLSFLPAGTTPAGNTFTFRTPGGADAFVLNTSVRGLGLNTTPTATLHAVNTATNQVTEIITSLANTSVDLAQYNLNVDDTATVANLATYNTNSNGTAAAGFGSSLTFNLETSTTNDQNAARLQWQWTDATHATRTADIVFQNVHLAAALATTFTIRSNGYYLWLGAKRVSTQFDKTNETLADITGLSVNVAAGRTYTFQATLYTTSDVAGGVKFAIAGTATATAIAYEAVDCQGGLTVATGTQRAAALATAVGDVTAVTTAYVRITGTITVNAAGTLTVQSARNAAVGTTSVLVGSVFIVNEIS